MLVYLGLICIENMQIEGFWYYLFTGVFEAATIHYAVAKIFGPLIFGRGLYGYACWTAMALDFLPYKAPRQPRKKIGWIRYNVGNIERIMFWTFLTGNIPYCFVGIILAFSFKDNFLQIHLSYHCFPKTHELLFPDLPKYDCTISIRAYNP